MPGSNRVNSVRSFLQPVIKSFPVCRESCVFQVQVTSPLSDTQEMEEQIRYLLLAPYNSGSVSIATEDVQINRICERSSGSVKDYTV